MDRIPLVLDRPGAMGAGAAAALVIVGLTASSDDGPVLCVLRRCSGGYCPGCGLARSAGLMLRGDPAGSWARHPYLALLLGQLGVLGLVHLADPQRLRQALARHGPGLIMANTLLLIGIWLVRLTTGTIPLPFG